MILIKESSPNFLRAGFCFGYWGFSNKREVSFHRKIHIKHADTALCKKIYNDFMYFYPVGITLRTFASDYDNICRECLLIYNHNPPTLKLRLGL
ncbi:hypothetical protein LCGC14_0911510 [marine sediment metagenome]|uniref:Uncharacterized protein n=1 Tax=marine sediment metagenome TaxID=412755 RepID=A0A0F9NY73_9ZZZZ